MFNPKAVKVVMKDRMIQLNNSNLKIQLHQIKTMSNILKQQHQVRMFPRRHPNRSQLFLNNHQEQLRNL